MRKLLVSFAFATATILCASANNDPVLMTVNGKDVKLSEFEYLYNKNNSQQMQKQSIDEYVDMFVTYKLKVADAEAAGIDTTASFRAEFNQHRNELVSPYLQDNTVLDRLVNEAYMRMQEDVKVSHIMLHISEDPNVNNASKARLDSIRNEILAGKATFAEMAQKYSSDRSTSSRGGSMGWIVANRWPYPFEKAAWDTQKGGVSEVIETFAGFHIINVEDRRPASGQIHAKHILKLTQGKTPEDAQKAKAQIDSIHNVLLTKNADELNTYFSEMASTHSECGSRQQGGDLGWFGIGQMVPAFETAAFSLADGGLSAPIQTQFGWHIIYRIGSRGIGTLDECKPSITMAINNDERGTLPEKEKTEDLKKEHNVTIIKKNYNKVVKDIKKAGKFDSTMVAKWKNSDMAIIKVGNENVPVSRAIKGMPTTTINNASLAIGYFDSAIENLCGICAMEYEKKHIEEKHPELHNLVNEYRDGILLFEVSNRNVWEKAAKDKEGLEQYFQQNREKYSNWTSPKYKGFVVFATNDSVMNLAQDFLKDKTLDVDSVAPVLRKEFGRNVRVERVIAAKGENEIVDYIAFEGEKPAADKNKWQCCFGYMGKLLNAPEEAIDVRGQVTSDYQAQLEKEWVESLKKKYPVKINQKVLSQVKNK